MEYSSRTCIREIAAASDKVKAVAAIEPGGLFMFPEGEVPEDIPTNYAPVRAQGVSAEKFTKLIDQTTRTAAGSLIIYFGDYIPLE